jgi:hypothetical protein
MYTEEVWVGRTTVAAHPSGANMKDIRLASDKGLQGRGQGEWMPDIPANRDLIAGVGNADFVEHADRAVVRHGRSHRGEGSSTVIKTCPIGRRSDAVSTQLVPHNHLLRGLRSNFPQRLMVGQPNGRNNKAGEDACKSFVYSSPR